MAARDGQALEEHGADADAECLPKMLWAEASTVMSFSLLAGFKPPKGLFVHKSLFIVYYLFLILLILFGVGLFVLYFKLKRNPAGLATWAVAAMLSTLVPLLVVGIVGAYAMRT